MEGIITQLTTRVQTDPFNEEVIIESKGHLNLCPRRQPPTTSSPCQSPKDLLLIPLPIFMFLPCSFYPSNAHPDYFQCVRFSASTNVISTEFHTPSTSCVKYSFLNCSLIFCLGEKETFCIRDE